MAKRILQNISKHLVGAFRRGSNRREEVLENLNEVNSFAQNPEEFGRRKTGNGGVDLMNEIGIRRIAREAFAANMVSQMRKQIAIMASFYEGENTENARKAAQWISLFDKEIEALKKGEEVKNTMEDMRALEKHINEAFQKIQAAFKNITDNISTIGENSSILNTNFQTILSAVKKDFTAPSGKEWQDLTACITYANNLKNEYKRLTNKDIQINYLSNQQVETTLGLLLARKKHLVDEIAKDNTKRSTLTPVLRQIDDLIDILPSLLENPYEFEAMKKRVGFDNQQTSEEQLKAEYEKKINSACENYQRNFENLIKNFGLPKDSINALTLSVKTLDKIVEEYPNLPMEYREKYYNEKINEVKKQLAEKYGENVCIFCREYAEELYEAISNLKKFTYSSPIFEAARKEVMDLIQEMKESTKNSDIVIVFDENTQKLSITFTNGKIPKYEETIMTKEALEEMQAAQNNRSGAEKQEKECEEYLQNFYAQKYGLEYEKLASLYTKQGDLGEPQLDRFLLVDDGLKLFLKIDIETKIKKDFEQKYPKDFQEYLWNFSQELEKIRGLISTLNRLPQNDPSIVQSYEMVMQRLTELIKNADKKYIENITLEENRILKIEFTGTRLPSYTEELMSSITLKKVQAQKDAQRSNLTERLEQLKNCRQSYATYFDKVYKEEERALIGLYNLYAIPAAPDADEFPLLTQDEVEQIAHEEEGKVKKPFEQKYPEAFRNYIFAFARKLGHIRGQINSLNAKQNQDNDLQQAYDKVINDLQTFIATADKNYIENITLDDQKKLKITFKENKIPPYEEQIVPLELQEKMKKAAPGTGSGHNPSGGDNQTPSEEEKQAIQNYIHKVEEINRLIQQINGLNNSIIIYDITNRSAVIAAEASAQKLEAMVMSLRVDLSQYRLDFESKFGKYMTTIDEVKNCNIINVEFPYPNLEVFMEMETEKITEAEEKIIDLAQERKTATEERTAEINMQMQEIMDYIDARNAYANRRLAEECRINKIDIVTELQKRRKMKNERRQRLEKIRKGEPSSKPIKPTPNGSDDKNPKGTPTNEDGVRVDIETPGATVKPSQRLVFNPRNKTALADREKDFITRADHVTISLIKSGIKIKYSQQLKEKLSQLNAKLSLVNKEKPSSRTSRKIDGTTEEQTLSFKDGRDLLGNDEYKNYKIEIRIPDGKNKTDVLFEYDLNPEEGVRRSK